MSKKTIINYVCQDCGTVHPKWSGKCEGCQGWNTIIEERVSKNINISSFNKPNLANSNLEVFALEENIAEPDRILTQIEEFDRVLGGGFVSGSAVLLGGDPGIGKSTILLQAAMYLSNNGHQCLYISGEESVEQIKLRAKRVNVKSTGLRIASLISLNDIMALVSTLPELSVLVIDSIQTIFHEEIESSPGTVSQVKACAFELIRLAKSKGIVLILVGHVNKDGNLAGPKVLEHMVDTVLYFEGEREYQFRIIRSVKNRFGAVNEIGVFEMKETGLEQVTNPSSIFLPNQDQKVSGSCIFAGVEGTRPILVEIQALIVPSYLPTPRRAVVGWDLNRLAMMIAVLNSRYGINLLDKEVYLNVAGGLRINEPAADLAVVAALISAAKNIPIDNDAIFFGEVGLSGEIRQVVHAQSRLNEAYKLGFKTAFIPKSDKTDKNNPCKIHIKSVNHIKGLQELFI